jgi:hypothetical protein
MEGEDGGVVKWLWLWLWHPRGHATGLSVRRSAASEVVAERISAHAAVRAAHHLLPTEIWTVLSPLESE